MVAGWELGREQGRVLGILCGEKRVHFVKLQKIRARFVVIYELGEREFGGIIYHVAEGGFIRRLKGSTTSAQLPRSLKAFLRFHSKKTLNCFLSF